MPGEDKLHDFRNPDFTHIIKTYNFLSLKKKEKRKTSRLSFTIKNYKISINLQNPLHVNSTQRKSQMHPVTSRKKNPVFFLRVQDEVAVSMPINGTDCITQGT